MSKPPIPEGESARLRELYRLRVLDTGPEEAFDRLTRVASRVLETPIALVSLVDEHRQWFKSQVGLDGVTETPREHAFCGHAIAGEDTMVVTDARKDPRFVDNPLVTGPPHIRFYAGALLRTEAGAAGTLCVIGRQPRDLAPDQRATLEDLAAVASEALGARLARDLAAERLHVLELAEVGHWHLDVDEERVFWSPEVKRIHGLAPDAPHPTLAEALAAYHPDDRERVTELVEQAVRERQSYDFEARIIRPDGAVRLVWAVGMPQEDAGRVRAVFGVFHDQTSQRHATERLHHTQKMAALGILAAGVAHEVNNPSPTWWPTPRASGTSSPAATTPPASSRRWSTTSWREPSASGASWASCAPSLAASPTRSSAPWTSTARWRQRRGSPPPRCGVAASSWSSSPPISPSCGPTRPSSSRCSSTSSSTPRRRPRAIPRPMSSASAPASSATTNAPSSRSSTTGWGCRRRCWRKPSGRSSRPNRVTRGQGSGCRSAARSSRASMAASPSSRPREGVPSFASASPSV